jgi:uncharacterized OB-fold protein
MSTPKSDYPHPHEDQDNQAMLAAWRDGGRLMLQHCEECGRTIFYPRAICPHCWSDALCWREAEGRGSISSFSLVRRPNHAAFFDEVPIILAEIRLAENVAMIARLIAPDPSVVEIGAQIALIGRPEADRYPLPTFRLLKA